MRWFPALFLFFLAFPAALNAQVFGTDSVTVTTAFCDTPTPVCLGLPATDFPDYTILLDGEVYTSAPAGCAFDTIITYSYNTLYDQGNSGPYALTAWTVNGETFSGQFGNVANLVALMNSWDPTGNWTHLPDELTIIGGGSGTTYTDMQVTALLNGSPSIIGLNFGLDPQGTAFVIPSGTHALTVQHNESNLRDTVIVTVECLPAPTPETVTQTIDLDAGSNSYKVCLSDTELTGPIVSLTDLCPDENGTFVNFFLDQATGCVKYSALECNGTERACVIACDAAGLCDTTYFEITVSDAFCQPASEKITDAVLLNFSQTYCLDTDELPGNVIAIENACFADANGYVDFAMDGAALCVTYTGLEPGVDEACIVLTDDLGFTDTTYFCITVTTPVPQTILDTLIVGQSVTHCLSTAELTPGTFTFYNDCDNPQNGVADYTLDDVSLCVEIDAVEVGQAAACLIVCDALGSCDTTTFSTVVVPNTDFLVPLAMDDTVTIYQNTQTDIAVLLNDRYATALPVTVSLVGTQSGTAEVGADNVIRYTPKTDLCGMDQFVYELCNANGCDLARVTVEVLCEEAPVDDIVVYTGFSPNGDGVNDFFTLKNIELYPEHRVRVYNRWGILVLERENNYRNDWAAVWSGKDLPDGTYFYQLEYDGKNQYGYLQINR